MCSSSEMWIQGAAEKLSSIVSVQMVHPTFILVLKSYSITTDEDERYLPTSAFSRAEG